MKKFTPKPGPAVIPAYSSNKISDEYRDQITISYRFLGCTPASTDFVLNGRHYATPIMAGPIAGPALETPESILAYAQAVQQAGSIYWATFHNFAGWQQTLAAGVPAIRVIKPLADNDRLLEEIRHDAEHGAVGFAMDIDHGITPYGEWDAQQEAFASKTAQDIALLAASTPLPFYLKGVLSVEDALLAKQAGAAGVVLSGHNNRFPCAVPPLKLLPQVRAAVGEDFCIFVDGGLNTGYDAFKALALGANGVLCAKTLLGAFVKNGPEGLTDKLLEMTAELKGAMSNTASPDLGHLNRGSVLLP